jgi:nitroimidazol reductase NimA-like FMN-containing flavoprotein (pyridoxamine 5'-phosphate oxidase superfamily)
VKDLWKPRVASVLRDASFAYLAVETSSGPHVTPLLFGATPDRLWFGIGRRTLKARVLAKRPAVGVVVPGTKASVAIRGEATLLDRLPASTAELALAPFALPAFVSSNALEMAAFARDVARRGAEPQALAPLSVRVETLDLLDGWPADSVLGWMAAGGPIALPAVWDPGTQRARVPAAPLKNAGGPRTAAACVCIDESEGLGPLAKRGRLLRGQGHARLRGDVASVTLDQERVTRWKGFQTQTAVAAGR